MTRRSTWVQVTKLSPRQERTRAILGAGIGVMVVVIILGCIALYGVFL